MVVRNGPNPDHYRMNKRNFVQLLLQRLQKSRAVSQTVTINYHLSRD